MRARLALALVLALMAAPCVAPAAQEGGVVEVRANRGFLSVNAQDASFGDVIAAVSDAVGFEADISDEVYHKRITTKFKDVELHRAIQRLLSRISQKNFSIYYDRQGRIKRLEVYGGPKGGRTERRRQGGTAGRPGAVQPPPLTIVAPEKAPPTPAAPPPAPAGGDYGEGSLPKPPGIYMRTAPAPAATGAGEPGAVEEPAAEGPPTREVVVEEETIPEEWEKPDESLLLDAPLLPGNTPAYIPPGRSEENGQKP